MADAGGVCLQDPSVERFEGSFHVETPSHHTHYDYVVETVKDRVHLEEVMAIDAVTCHGDRLTIAFNASTEATAFAATLNPGRTVITILAAWRGCGAKSIIKKVATNANIQISGTDVTVTTIEASITSLFKVLPTLLPPPSTSSLLSLSLATAVDAG